MISLALILVSS